MTKPKHILGSDEIARLQTRAALIVDPTTLLLQRGGIRPGMRVLDLGSGPGDVAFQVAEMIGPSGSVLGVEQDPAQIAVAMQRRDGFGLRNVDFRHGDARTFLDEEPFDAVVCRLLLLHLPDVVDVLAHHLRNLRPGGVFIAVDYDVAGVRAARGRVVFTPDGVGEGRLRIRTRQRVRRDALCRALRAGGFP